MTSIPAKKIVPSASRRTDIPAFYMPWFMAGIERGFFEVTNPYNGKVSTVPASPEAVHTIVFWSKDFGPFLDGEYGEALERLGYHLLFNFTVNSENRDLEPRVPPLEKRLGQLTELCLRFSPDAVFWRFDPICFYRTGEGIRDNLGDFEQIADRAQGCGISRCITSFLDLYPKIRKRSGENGSILYNDLPMPEQKNILLAMNDYVTPRGIGLYTCCEKDLLEELPPGTGILPSACIPSMLIESLYGPGISLSKDTGQRREAGCGCGVSTDIGSYAEHPCYHNCLFCYANPAAWAKPAPVSRKKDNIT